MTTQWDASSGPRSSSKRGVAKRESLGESVEMRVPKTLGGGGGRRAGVYNRRRGRPPPAGPGHK